MADRGMAVGVDAQHVRVVDVGHRTDVAANVDGVLTVMAQHIQQRVGQRHGAAGGEADTAVGGQMVTVGHCAPFMGG